MPGLKNLVVLIFLCVSCVIATIDPIEPAVYNPVIEHYESKIEKEASLAFKCKTLKIEVAEKAYLMRQFEQTFIVTDIGDEDARDKLKNSVVPVSYNVSGCDKSARFVLINPGKKGGLCSIFSNTADFYLDKTCIPIQEPTI